MPYRINPPPVSPAARILVAFMAVIFLLAALFFGLVVLLVMLGLMAVFAVFAWLRLRWPGAAFRRKTGRAETSDSRGREIEGEYTVVSRRRD